MTTIEPCVTVLKPPALLFLLLLQNCIALHCSARSARGRPLPSRATLGFYRPIWVNQIDLRIDALFRPTNPPSILLLNIQFPIPRLTLSFLCGSSNSCPL